jgi:hypothetical protein
MSRLVYSEVVGCVCPAVLVSCDCACVWLRYGHGMVPLKKLSNLKCGATHMGVTNKPGCEASRLLELAHATQISLSSVQLNRLNRHHNRSNNHRPCSVDLHHAPGSVPRRFVCCGNRSRRGGGGRPPPSSLPHQVGREPAASCMSALRPPPPSSPPPLLTQDVKRCRTSLSRSNMP